jgi:hypothetical protein
MKTAQEMFLTTYADVGDLETLVVGLMLAYGEQVKAECLRIIEEKEKYDDSPVDAIRALKLP